jgi:DNA-binding transcriptional LysR family regulator
MTSAGKILYEYSIRFATEKRNLNSQIAEEVGRRNTIIHMGMIDNVGLIFVGKIYKRFLKKYPFCRLQIQVDNSHRLLKRVEKTELDFAIITRQKNKPSYKFVTTNFADEKMILVASPNISSKIKSKLDLRKIGCISYNKSSTTHQLIHETFTRNGILMHYIAFSSSPDFILEMARLGSGVAVLPQNLVKSDIAKKRLVEIQIQGLTFNRGLSLLYLKNMYLPKITKEFIEQLRKAF